VIPARNEADRIGPLFKALGTLSYPALEIVFVDDRSTDGTMRLIEEFAPPSRKEGSGSCA
jgi:4,4'-diaponeurosporenoate glycosyltransferase